MTTSLRVSAVSYLNTCPLIWGLVHGGLGSALDLRFELPAACARSIENGEAAVGLVPVIEAFRQKLQVASDVGIISSGQVRSIFLLHRRPLRQIRSIALDSSSRTSVALARIILAERYQVRPVAFRADPDPATMLEAADSALIIGDPALRLAVPNSGFDVIDLGEEWQALTALPMVYAVWAGKTGSANQATKSLFRDSYEYGKARIEEIVLREAPPRGVAAPLARDYLTKHIRYELSPAALAGMREFERLARKHDQIDTLWSQML